MTEQERLNVLKEKFSKITSKRQKGKKDWVIGRSKSSMAEEEKNQINLLLSCGIDEDTAKSIVERDTDEDDRYTNFAFFLAKEARKKAIYKLLGL
jgi:hypothetical protein